MDTVSDLFYQTGALLRGHFILRSGLHSREFCQCALLLQHAKVAEYVCGILAEKLLPFQFQTVVSPALGGMLVGHEIARQLNKRHVFVEKDVGRALALRRGFTVLPGEKVVIAEDVVTLGGRVKQTIDIIQSLGGDIVAVSSIVDRSGSTSTILDFGCPFIRLLRLEIDTFEKDNLPPDLAALPVMSPGSTAVKCL